MIVTIMSTLLEKKTCLSTRTVTFRITYFKTVPYNKCYLVENASIKGDIM